MPALRGGLILPKHKGQTKAYIVPPRKPQKFADQKAFRDFKMALTWPQLLLILNVSIAFFSLALVAIAPAAIYLTAHGTQRMNQNWSEGIYQWYRGPSWDMDNLPFVRLTYLSANEPLIYTAAAISILAGLAGITGSLVKQKVSFSSCFPFKPSSTF